MCIDAQNNRLSIRSSRLVVGQLFHAISYIDIHINVYVYDSMSILMIRSVCACVYIYELSSVLVE